MNQTSHSDIATRPLGDSFAVAVIHWPAVVGFMEVGNQGWELAVRIALGVWIVVLSLAMIAGRGKAGAQWGLAMTMCAGLVAAFWAAHPGAWMYLFLGLLFLFFHVALRARLQEPSPETDEPERPSP